MKNFLSVCTSGGEKTVLKFKERVLSEMSLHEDDALFLLKDILTFLKVMGGFDDSNHIIMDVEKNEVVEDILDVQIWANGKGLPHAVVAFCVEDYKDFEKNVEMIKKGSLGPKEHLGGIVCGGSVKLLGVEKHNLKKNKDKLNRLISAINPLEHDFIEITMTDRQNGDLHIEWMDIRTGNPKAELHIKDYTKSVLTI